MSAEVPMNRSVRYQVMPPLSPDEYQELHDDIKANGVLVPIVEDEDGVIIDGHHRSKIASELGVPCPVEIVERKSESEKRGMAFTLNLKRRHLNREQRRALIAESLKSDPQLSNREHARRTGASDNTVSSVRQGLESTAQIAQSDKRMSADGRVRPASQPQRVTPDAPDNPDTTETDPVSEFIDQNQINELNRPPLPEPAAAPPVHTEEDQRPNTYTEYRLTIDLMNQLRKALENVQEATLIANKLTTWPGAPLSDDIRAELDNLDNALRSGGMDAQLQRLIEGNDND